jgi:hypothetical protein
LPQQQTAPGSIFRDRFSPAPRSRSPRLATPYRWFRIFPHRTQAWRELNELPDRELMRDGRWLV